jgi:invasion protein IalB
MLQACWKQLFETENKPGARMLGKNIKAAAAVALTSLLLQATTAGAQADGAAVAGNNSFSVNETHGDWILLCSDADKAKICVMTQQQRKADTNQLVIAAEVTNLQDKQTRATLVLPFGLALEAGMTFQVDDGPVSKPAPFSTCLPAGCIVKVLLDQPTLDALRGGTSVKLTAKALESGQTVLLGLSLKGFSTALDRLLTFTK